MFATKRFRPFDKKAVDFDFSDITNHTRRAIRDVKIALGCMIMQTGGTKMGRIIAAMLIAIAAALPASAMDASALPLPSSVTLSWSGAEGAVYYDIYSGEDFIVRLESGDRSYTVNGLSSDTHYDFSVAARDEENRTLDAAFLSAETDSWDGIYEWKNLTDKDNRGKVKDLRIRVETADDPSFGQFHELYMIMDDGSEEKIFPLYSFTDPESGKWVDYDGTSQEAIAYRLNADRLNTSIFNPGRWRLARVVIGHDSGSATVETSAFGITVETLSSYHFFIEDGVKKMEYRTEGSGLADAILFRNPNPGEGDAFILTER